MVAPTATGQEMTATQSTRGMAVTTTHVRASAQTAPVVTTSTEGQEAQSTQPAIVVEMEAGQELVSTQHDGNQQAVSSSALADLSSIKEVPDTTVQASSVRKQWRLWRSNQKRTEMRADRK